MTWAICHKSGTVLFTTSDERTMLNRKSHGCVIKMSTISNERLEEIAEEDNGSDVLFESSVLARELLALRKERERADPVAWRWNYGGTTTWRLLDTKPMPGTNPNWPRVIQPLYAAPPAPVVADVDPSFDAMMHALDAFYADDDVPERAMLAAFKILLADVSKR